MAGERTYPILPVPDLDLAVEFYSRLGFEVSYRQRRPNPYAVVVMQDLCVHLAGVEGYQPESAAHSVVVVVPDLVALRERFVRGLRSEGGTVPTSGIPRLLRIRRKAGTATGFSLVEPGGAWLRFYQQGAREDREPRAVGLARVLETAARQGDARGDESQALRVLEAGLARHRDADPALVAEALDYRDELRRRLGR